ncbi:hypothetical protein J3Q64DRAFT_1834112 [Phycomyces blakesleeanus]|uniref:Uncharacterized protein n=2 Tax=Phycomyces blakesleeanus TaxID=4837 RepID=A0A162PYN9_PHYB8|nr:hypothetical protein PHYBLDRAFT_143755 [Phycomyces blakesleeanus NRRL 1555(-)]OAD75506.1 hypothetical protein PHYBLDRAFT_143755 [Phycomyces blakesleeanus NRRL 1555(-)]|eukprot:XP_018293546.1 hypothetical protein PHYBLDRAFT_143755 [Phycomyces blakesleeanus NRRL 1555(-)]
MHTSKFVEVTAPVTNVLPLPNQNQDAASNVTDPETRGLGKLEDNEAPESDNSEESNLGPESTSTTAATDGCNNLWKTDQHVALFLKVILDDDTYAKILRAKNNSSLKRKIWKDLVDKFMDLNDDYFKNMIDGGKCGKKSKDLTKTYKLRTDRNRRKTGYTRSCDAFAWAFFNQMKEILINNPSVHPWNFGQSRTSRPTSMTTTSSNGRIVWENIFGDGRREIEVLSEAVVSNNTNTNTNYNHASDLNSVISDNEDVKSLTATQLLSEKSGYPTNVNEILNTITHLHKKMQDEVAAERDVFISQLLGTPEQKVAKRARDEKDRELVYEFTKANINELQHRQL